MNTRRFTNPAMLVVSGLAVIALAACSGGHSSTPRPSASASAGAVDLRTAWLNVSKCMRANGYPDFPDPVENANGQWEIPESAVAGNPQVPACDALGRQAKQASKEASRPSAENLAKIQQYARCMREHGVHDFPDPDEYGEMDVTQDMRGNPAFDTARDACHQYLPPQPPGGKK
jgi:hypothetical protein